MPTTMKTLIPLDGSAFSRTIITHIKRVFRPADQEIILLRVTDQPEGLTALPPRLMSPVWPVPMYESSREAERAKHPIYASQVWASVSAMLEDELVPVVHDLQESGFCVSVAVRFGDPVEEIVRFVESEGMDLVAMATHGRTGLGTLVLGSVASGVLHRLKVPVVLVRPFDHLASDASEQGSQTKQASVPAYDHPVAGHGS